jgi:hypothetical protein
MTKKVEIRCVDDNAGQEVVVDAFSVGNEVSTTLKAGEGVAYTMNAGSRITLLVRSVPEDSQAAQPGNPTPVEPGGGE